MDSCGAKLPVIAMIAAIIATKFTNSDGSWVGPAMYGIGILSVLLASIILKKTKYFHGPAAPFIMELPQYHIPQLKTVLLHTWERLWSFIKKAGTILFLACLVMWFLSSYGWSVKTEESENETVAQQTAEKPVFGLVEDANDSIMAKVGGVLRYAFVPLGFGNEEGGWQCAASVISGFSAKEGIVTTMGVLAGASDEDTEALAGAGDVSDVISGEEAGAEESEDGNANNAVDAIALWFPTGLVAFCFLLFNLLDSPCLAAISTMANELRNRKWFWFAILFQNAFAYIVTLIVYQLGNLFTTGHFGIGTVFAIIFVLMFLYGLFRKNPYAEMDKKN